jgi:Protein of unknown function (Hypoth_ymh)
VRCFTSNCRGAVYDNFASGSYDTSARETAKLPATLVGVKLMREAFNPNAGKLTDMALPMAERERMADLFAGAIGTFKNPLSHRKFGNTDPAPVIEELLFASRLLRFLR